MSLHPEIERLLGAFERRRRRLLLVRGTLGGAAALLLGTLLAVLVDGPLVLEDEPRVGLAVLVYGGGALAFCWLAFRHFNLGSRVKVAAVLEATAPQLRGCFLAAVELLPVDGEGDSPAFRSELQEQTARRIRGISVHGLLPLHLLKRDLRLLLCAALAIGCGFAIDGTRFGWRCARALLPLANFERLSDAVITVLLPSPVEGIVPAEEPLPIAVSVVAPGEVEPLLLTRQPDGSRLRIPLRAAGPGRFEANLPVDKAPLTYQIRAGYSLTRRFRLEPRPRPKVASYGLTYHYPEYTGLPARKVASLDGALSALEGTTVEVEFTPDQAVAAGSLALTLGRTSRELPLAGESGEGHTGRLHARFEITEGGAYTVRMVSAETGLKSAAGPQHAISIELDGPPKLALDLPVQDVVVPLGDKVPLEGAAEDDFGLGCVELDFRRNETGWRSKRLGEMVGREFQIRTAFDPLSEKARPGDVWSVRFSATDARGQRGESRTLRISMAPPGTVARPDRALAVQRALFQKVKELATESAEAVSSLEKLKAQTERGTPDDLKANEALVRAQQALEKSVQAGETARSQLLDALQQAASGEPTAQEESVLRQEARVLGTAQAGDLPAALEALERLRPLADKKAANVEAVRFAHEAAAAGAHNARLVEESVRTRLDAMEAAALAPAARTLSTELAKSQGDAAQTGSAEERLPGQEEALRRQQVNQTLSSQLQLQLQKLAERAPPAAGALRPALDELRRSQAAAEKALQATAAAEVPQATAPVEAAGTALARSLERAAVSLEGAAPALQAAAERAQLALGRADRTAGETLERNGREIAALAAKQNLPAAMREAEAALKAAAAAGVLRSNAEVESIGQDTAPKLARAQVLAAAALEALPEAGAPLAAPGNQAAELARSLKAVEAAAATDSAARKADKLAARLERQNGPASPAQMAERKQLKEGVQNLPKQIREARLPELAAEKTRDAVDALGGNAPAGLTRAAEALKAGAEAGAENADKALAEIAKKAPSLAKQLERLAAQAARDAGSTAALAQQANPETKQPSNQPAEPGAEKPGEKHGESGGETSSLDGALRAGLELERKLEQVRQMLRTEANAQDVRSASGREAARDADGAAAQIKDAGTRAQAALRQAATRAAERQPLLEKAAAFQKQGAAQLRALAENMQKLDSADPAERAAAREALRAGDKTAGEGTRLDARQERLAELAGVADLAKQSPEAALAKAQAMEAASARTSADSPPGTGDASAEATAPQEGSGKDEGSPQGNHSKGGPAEGQKAAASALAQAARASLAEALAALKEGGEKNATRAAQALSDAVDAQAAADRGERTQEGAAPVGGANSNAGLSGMADAGSLGLPPEKRGPPGEWGNLPRRLATDMVDGRREAAPSEYREAVEAYFRAVAERARGAARPQ